MAAMCREGDEDWSHGHRRMRIGVARRGLAVGGMDGWMGIGEVGRSR